jgi:hypothetical protein
MPRKQKLSAAAVRKIYTSKESAQSLSARYGVSPNAVYLIRQGRRRQDITRLLTKGTVTRKRRTTRRAAKPIDMRVLADAVLDRLIARLRKI